MSLIPLLLCCVIAYMYMHMHMYYGFTVRPPFLFSPGCQTKTSAVSSAASLPASGSASGWQPGQAPRRRGARARSEGSFSRIPPAGYQPAWTRPRESPPGGGGSRWRGDKWRALARRCGGDWRRLRRAVRACRRSSRRVACPVARAAAGYPPLRRGRRPVALALASLACAPNRPNTLPSLPWRR